MKTISRNELESWQDSNRSFALIDVLPGSTHHRQEPSAESTGTFLEKLCRLGIGNEQTIVLYEGSAACIEAATAAEILMREGFHEVYCFIGPQAAFYETQHRAAQ